MKTFAKSFVVGLVALTLVSLPGLMGLANAGGINYEGFSGYRVDNSMGNDDKARGLMFNFSFGGPKDYKENATIQDIYKASLTSGEKTGIFLGVISLAALILYITDDDDGCNYASRVEAPAFSFEALEVRLESEGRCGSIER